MPVEERRGHVSSSVKRSDRSNNAGNPRELEPEPECRKIDLLRALRSGRAYVGQEVAELLPFLSASGEQIITADQKPKVVSQRAIDRLLEGQRHDFRVCFAFGDAPQKRILAIRGRRKRGRGGVWF